MKVSTTQSIRLLVVALFAMATILALAPAANAAAKGPKIPSYHGHVTAVDTTAGTITIQQKNGSPQTFTVPTGAAVFVSDAVSTLANVEVGDAAHIKSADGKTALIIHAHPRVPHVKTPKGAARQTFPRTVSPT